MAGVVGLDHIVLDIRTKAVLGAEHRRQGDAGQGDNHIDDMTERFVHRRRVGEQPDPATVEPRSQMR
jgi:hypothetical protein